MAIIEEWQVYFDDGTSTIVLVNEDESLAEVAAQVADEEGLDVTNIILVRVIEDEH